MHRAIAIVPAVPAYANPIACLFRAVPDRSGEPRRAAAAARQTYPGLGCSPARSMLAMLAVLAVLAVTVMSLQRAGDGSAALCTGQHPPWRLAWTRRRERAERPSGAQSAK